MIFRSILMQEKTTWRYHTVQPGNVERENKLNNLISSIEKSFDDRKQNFVFDGGENRVLLFSLLLKYWLANYLFKKIYPYWFPCMRQCIIYYLPSTEDFNFENGIIKKKIGNLKIRYTLWLIQILEVDELTNSSPGFFP